MPNPPDWTLPTELAVHRLPLVPLKIRAAPEVTLFWTVCQV